MILTISAIINLLQCHASSMVPANFAIINLLQCPTSSMVPAIFAIIDLLRSHNSSNFLSVPLIDEGESTHKDPKLVSKRWRCSLLTLRLQVLERYRIKAFLPQIPLMRHHLSCLLILGFVEQRNTKKTWSVKSSYPPIAKKSLKMTMNPSKKPRIGDQPSVILARKML